MNQVACSMEDAVKPTAAMQEKAHVGSMNEYSRMYNESINDPDKFWGDIARTFHWEVPFNTVAESNMSRSKGKIYAKWFDGGKTNICYNAVDRHLEKNGDRVAIIWEGNDGEDEKITYKILHAEVCKFANVLKAKGVKKGDRVSIYMPMIPQIAYAMLACARIGAIHSVVFGGFSATSLADRILDSKCKVVVTADAVYRGQKQIALKAVTDEAVQKCKGENHNVDAVIVYERLGKEANIDWTPLDCWWHEETAKVSADCPVEWQDSEDPLFILYTSGSTGKPKGVLHTTAGYMVYASTTHKYIFDYHDGDIWWCTADAGWITGHSYIVYGPLLNGATTLVFEGLPTHPTSARCWEVCEKHQVTQFYTAPTAIRALMRCGDHFVKDHKRDSIRVLGTVGEPINPEAWKWYYEVVGDKKCPIVDTWWQTETGGIMITPLPGCTPLKPGSATLPFFGCHPVILSQDGKPIPDGPGEGYLAIDKPWPGMMRTVYGDHDRYEQTYYAMFDGYYLTGDGCRRDEDGFIWLTGRIDDVINVSGHRIGSAEVEHALVSCNQVAEAAVVGYPHSLKGEGIYAYVTLKDGQHPSNDLMDMLKLCVRKEIGPIATPDVIHWAPGLPKTRSGKIMRRILRKIAADEVDQLGDTSTLADPSVVDNLVATKHTGKKC